MKKVITYGTYDLLHYGHIRLLERAKALGDYLIVGVTADDFDRRRGKINVVQSLTERIEGVKALGIADQIIVEEYEGQKIDDIQKYDVDIFTVGSDWVGQFDYLNEYCEVVYLPRTEGVSSSEIRARRAPLRLGLVGDDYTLKKFMDECAYVNGIRVTGICSNSEEHLREAAELGVLGTSDYAALLEASDAVYLDVHPSRRFALAKQALESGRHVLCTPPAALSVEELDRLYALADEKHIVMMDAVKTAYSTAYSRLLVLAKSGVVGSIVSVDAAVTSLSAPPPRYAEAYQNWSSLYSWGPIGLLPVFQLLGPHYEEKTMLSAFAPGGDRDRFTQILFRYGGAVASVKVANGVKSEGELIISGTTGYIYVPAPWWKTDYFEIRRENQTENKRYFYQLDGEGIRYEISGFVQSITTGKSAAHIDRDVSRAIARVVEDFNAGRDRRMITVAFEN